MQTGEIYYKNQLLVFFENKLFKIHILVKSKLMLLDENIGNNLR